MDGMGRDINLHVHVRDMFFASECDRVLISNYLYPIGSMYGIFLGLKFKSTASMQGNIPYIRRIWVLNSIFLHSIFISFLIEFLGMLNSPCEFFWVGVSATTCRFFGHSENRIRIISTKSFNQYQ